jgi:hypothetical protein
MTSMKSDIVRRVDRLPKPRNTTEALQPLFEAVMNSIHSTQDKFRTQVAKKGRIEVTVTWATEHTPHVIVVKDNGVGLDAKNFEAFLTTDSDHKIDRGGKGIGRLLWLACFEKISIVSEYVDDMRKHRRVFDFRLSNENQIDKMKVSKVESADKNTGFTITFTGLRSDGYDEKFPKRPAYVVQHFLSHFLSIIVGTHCPSMTVVCDGEAHTFPSGINDFIYRRSSKQVDYDGNVLMMEMLECNKTVSSDLKGNNFIHFIAHDRTVHSQPIDSKLGFATFGDDGRVFHACLTGDFLNRHVSQERTRFTFEAKILEKIVNEACMPEIVEFLSEPLKDVKDRQIAALSRIVSNYPSVGFDTLEGLAERVPAGETDQSQLFGALSVERHRRDERQRTKIDEALDKLRNQPFSPAGFSGALQETSQAITETERRSLAEYVVRRKLVIHFLRELLKAIKDNPSDSDYELESTLHNFICPIRIGIGKKEPSSHDLWIIDERLTFARTFSSDRKLSDIMSGSGSADRPDVLVFDHAFGLRHGAGDPRVLIVEFKRPGRDRYSDDENPQFQVERYIRTMLLNSAIDLDGRPVRLSPNIRFHCFIIADRLGKLADWTSSWAATADGRGRIYDLRGDYQGFIELIEWDQLMDDAYERNRAFFDKSGI